MKKVLLVLLLIFPIVSNAQKAIGSQKEEKRTTKYEDFVSKSGVVYTTYSYPIDAVELIWNASTSTYKEKLNFAIEKMVIGNTSESFLNISHIDYDEASLVVMEEANVKELCDALIQMKEMGNNPVPEGAKAEYSYLNSDGVLVTFNGNLWKIQLEQYNKDKIFASSIDPLITKLQEIIQKFESIK